MLNKDYKDISQYLNDDEVSFLLVGAYALAVHGDNRSNDLGRIGAANKKAKITQQISENTLRFMVSTMLLFWVDRNMVCFPFCILRSFCHNTFLRIMGRNL